MLLWWRVFASALMHFSLAIELAAARVRVLPPPVLLQRSAHRFPVLTGGPRDRPIHQQTVQNTLDWSYQLLDAGTQIQFQRLGVFVGGWSLEAAEAVCTRNGDLPIDVLDGLAVLVDQSLVQQTELDGTPRFHMLQTIREYALEQLEASGKMPLARLQHANYCLAFTEHAEMNFRGQHEKLWMDRLEQEYDNLRAALAWVMEQEKTELGLRIAGTLWRFWASRGSAREGRAWLTRLLAQVDHTVPPVVHAKALHAAGVLARYQGDLDQATTLHEQSLALRREIGDKPEIAWSLTHLGNIARDNGRYEQATTYYTEKSRIVPRGRQRECYGRLAATFGTCSGQTGSLRASNDVS